MAELLYSAPFYQNVRKHSTNAGEILCTGKGCVACYPEKNGDKSIIKILGDVDTVNFEMESNNGEIHVLKRRERPETTPGCYGDNISGRHGGNMKTRKKIKKKTAKKLTFSERKTTPKILVTDFSAQNYENKKTKNPEKIESPKLKKNLMKNVQIGNEVANDSRKYLAVPSRSNTSHLKRTTAKKTKTLYKKESGKSSQIIKTVNTDKKIGCERKLFHTFPGARVTRSSSGKYGNNSQSNTSFLDMLKTSEVGIYDPKMMKLKNSSIWIEKILKQGIKEEDLLPRIPQALIERKSGDGSELETTDKITQTSLAANAYKANPMLPRLSFNGKVEVRGGESVLIIENEHDKKKDKDGVLHRIGFALEEPQLKLSRNFPKFSVIQIADSLGELVEMGMIKVIQRRNRRWLILVEGKNAKDFLLKNGVVLGGRHFELMDLKTF